MKSLIYGIITLAIIIISGKHSSEAWKCYNCTECSQPTNLVDCPANEIRCIVATGYTNGTFQMVRSCTSMQEDFYDWVWFKKRTLYGVEYTDVKVKTCFNDSCNDDFISIPKYFTCHSCVNCVTPTNSTRKCPDGCLTAAGLPFNGPYEVLRSCPTSDVANCDENGTHLFQKEFDEKVYNYVWLKICREDYCNNETMNYTNPFETDSYFDFGDTEVEDSASERKWNIVLIVTGFVIYLLLYLQRKMVISS